MIDEKKLIEDIKKHENLHWEYDEYDNDYTGQPVLDFQSIEETINKQPKAYEWIPCSERLPENANHKGALCPRYQVMTKYGVTEGWYNPDHESWYILAWFITGRLKESDIDMERGDIPRRLRVPEGVVIAWQPLPEPWEGPEERQAVTPANSRINP